MHIKNLTHYNRPVDLRITLLRIFSEARLDGPWCFSKFFKNKSKLFLTLTLKKQKLILRLFVVSKQIHFQSSKLLKEKIVSEGSNL